MLSRNNHLCQMIPQLIQLLMFVIDFYHLIHQISFYFIFWFFFQFLFYQIFHLVWMMTIRSIDNRRINWYFDIITQFDIFYEIQFHSVVSISFTLYSSPVSRLLYRCRKISNCRINHFLFFWNISVSLRHHCSISGNSLESVQKRRKWKFYEMKCMK